MIKASLQNSSEFIYFSFEQFAEDMGITWFPFLQFETKEIAEKVLRYSKRAIKKKELSIREKWLGIRFQNEISKGFFPKISVRWLHEEIGYGVFAEQDFLKGAFIGEYTGLVRKRSRRKDKKNNYCFEYTLGDWIYNPFIIDAERQGNFTRYINHSDTPNLETLSVYVEEIMHIILVTIRPIKKGEQLCYHYGDTFWKKCRQSKISII